LEKLGSGGYLEGRESAME